ncbi:MAG: hypothetical protein CMH63_01415 [Nanoarchaeota archaeon]|jgi:hypothetical protein|nr:hypothetical protein [Nanoarchaeota archaeon]|tara:strand:- start:63839 stop:64210 length:372 start_codon:yes stop_codon:yes gene_type:complete
MEDRKMNKKLRNVILGAGLSAYLVGTSLLFSLVKQKETEFREKNIKGFMPTETKNCLMFERGGGPGRLLLTDDDKDGSLDFWINSYCGFRWGGAVFSLNEGHKLDRFQPLYTELFQKYQQKSR